MGCTSGCWTGKLTAIMTVKADPQEGPSRYTFLDFMADCVIHVDQRVTGAGDDAALESGQVSRLGLRPQRISLHHR